MQIDEGVCARMKRLLLLLSILLIILTFAGAFVLAYACLKLYDEPIRKWLTDRFLKGKKAVKN